MNCQEVHQLIIAYIDGEVASSERTLIQAHLARCEPCRRELAALSAIQSRISWSLKDKAAQASPSPQAWSRLQVRLAEQEHPAAPWPLTWLKRIAPDVGPISHLLQGGMTMKKGLAFATLMALMIALGTAAFVPSVRAQVSEILNAWFRIEVPGGRVEITVSGPGEEFTPLQPTYLPDAILSGVASTRGSVTTGAGEGVSLFFGNLTGQWLYITQSPASADKALPEGERVEVNGQEAVLLTGQSGVLVGPPRRLSELMGDEIELPPGCLEAMVAEPREETGALPPECERAAKKAGGVIIVNGRAYKSKHVGPPEMQYENAVRLIWHVDNVRIEMLSNLPVEEVLKVAASMVRGRSSP